jgi:hypothetical protein
VLVASCSISALEIASDIALCGARSVTACYRRQRNILPKLIAGSPLIMSCSRVPPALPPNLAARGGGSRVEGEGDRRRRFAGPVRGNTAIRGQHPAQRSLTVSGCSLPAPLLKRGSWSMFQVVADCGGAAGTVEQARRQKHQVSY